MGHRDLNVRDPILLLYDMNEAKTSLIRNKVEREAGCLKIWESGLVHVAVPQVLHFPEIVEWCALAYISERREVMSKDATREVISITPESIAKMFSFPLEATSISWNE